MRRPVGYITKRARNRTAENAKGQTVWVARLSYVDRESGRKVDRMRTATTKHEAGRLLDELRGEYRTRGRIDVDKRLATFADLAQSYTDAHVHPAEYRAGRKTSGLKSHYQVTLYLDVLRNHFKRRRVRDIRHSDILAFRRLRLRTPVKHGGERSIAAVNRELETFRALFRFAVREGYVDRTPFDDGEVVIKKHHEQKRERVMSFEEETRLLNACTGRYQHLRALIILAVDTGLRRGELFQLTWDDVDMEQGSITIRAETEKANRGRKVALTARAMNELAGLRAVSELHGGGLVFNIVSTIKNGWQGICRLAEIQDLRFHDLRHTCVTRLIQSGVPHAEVLKIAGHSTLAMLSRYLNPGDESLVRAADSLNRLLETRELANPATLLN